jgi:transposase
MAKPTYDELAELVIVQAELIKSLTAEVKLLRAEVAELKRRLDADSSNSSRPPSSDSPFTKKPAKARSSRRASGRKPGKQNGDPGVSRSLSDSPDQVINIDPMACSGCHGSLTNTAARMVDRRQIVDLPAVAAPVITEYRLGATTCRCCGVTTTADWTDNTDINTEVLATPGSPVRIGPAALAMCAYLTCAHYLPIGRANTLMETLTGLHLATGFTARARRRAANKLVGTLLPHLQQLLATAPVLHADETTGRADHALTYVHVACTEYLTLMHVGGRSSADIDHGGVLATFTGVLVRDGYAGYDHLPALHAWCGAHLLRDLRSLSDADQHGQLWATAMADTLTAAHHAAAKARQAGLDRLDDTTLATLLNHYLGALAKGRTDNLGDHSELARRARTLIRRFHRYQDMILRFTTDLTIPLDQQPSRTGPTTSENPAPHPRRMLAHPGRPHRIRHRPLLPGHRRKMGQKQTRRPHRTVHHRPMATHSPGTQLNTYHMRVRSWVASMNRNEGCRCMV